MMRYLLMMVIAFCLVASYGCGESKKSGRTIEDTVKMAQNQGESQSNPGPAMDRSKRLDSRKDAEQDNSEDDKQSDEATDEAESDSGDENAEDGEANKPPPRTRRSSARRKRNAPQPAMSGGGGDTNKMREEMERGRGNRSGTTSNSTPDTPGERPDTPVREEEVQEERIASFMDRAKTSFSLGHDPEAFQYLYAHFLTDEDALSNHPMGWFEGIMEPRVGLRWGVAVDYSPGSFEGDPPTIGDPVQSSTDSSGSRGGGGGGGDFNVGGSGGQQQGAQGMSAPRSRRRAGRSRGNSDTGGGDSRSAGSSRNAPERTPEEELKYYTGEFGDKFVRRYEMRRRHDDAFYGQVMQEISTTLPDVKEDNVATNEEKPKRRSGGSSDFGVMGGGTSTGDQLADYRNRKNRGGDRNAAADDEPEYEADPTALAPGLMMLGVGDLDDMLANAKSQSIDVLVVFDVSVKHSERRSGTSTKSNTRIRMYSVKTGELLVKDTKSLSNVAVASAREKGREDPVEIELDKVFRETADKAFKSADLPDFDDAKFRARFDYLMKQEYDNPLPVLVEIKHYLEAGVISDNDYVSACEKFLGDVEAQGLIDGDLKKQEFALRDYLPGRFSVNTTSGGGDFR